MNEKKVTRITERPLLTSAARSDPEPCTHKQMKKKHQSHLITFNQILRALYRSDDNLVSNATLMWFISNVLSWLPNKINNCSNNNDNETHVTCVSCV